MKRVHFFATPDEFRAWLDENHSTETELFVGFYKKASGKPSLTWPESVDAALCYGWIDGVRNAIDEVRYQIRFTPRKPSSTWSAVNVKRVAELQKLGLMRPAGIRAFESPHGRQDRHLCLRTAQECKAAACLREEIPRQQKSLGVLSIAAPLVSADSELSRNQRQARSYPREAPGSVDPRFPGRSAHQGTQAARKQNREYQVRMIRLLAMLILICGTICAHAQSPVANTPEGFQSQFHAIFEAFQQHNESAMQDRLQSFALPSHWFPDAFVAAQAPQFAHQYAEAFAEFKRRSAANFGGIDALKTRMHVDPASPVDIRTRRWTPAESSAQPYLPALPQPLPTVQKFEIDCVLDGPGQGARLTSWIESFIYVDGAFRYFGQPRKPFWMTSPPPRAPKSPDN